MRKIVVVAAFVLIGCDPPPAVAPENPGATPEQPATADETAQAEEAEPAEAEETKKEPSQDNLPEATEVLAKSVEAVGGQGKIDAIKSYYQETALDIPAQGMKAVTRTWWKGGLFYTETEVTNVGVTKIWKTADGLWSHDPVNGLREIEGAEARQHAWANSLVIAADWKKFLRDGRERPGAGTRATRPSSTSS